jgi:hypothetical protein
MADTNPAATSSATRKATKKPRSTFMLHDPKDMSSLGKYVSTDYRYAALKVASRGHTDILLRRTNTKEVRVYRGEVVTLDNPKKITRSGRVIEYNKKPQVHFVRKFVYDGPIKNEESTEQSATTQ